MNPHIADASGRRLLCRWVVVALMSLGVLVGAEPASARHNLSVLTVGPAQIQPGGEVEVSGYSYTQPVSIRFNALDGRVLTTLTPDSNSDIRGPVVIPPETKPGFYVLYAVQDSTGKPSRLPARGRIAVVGEGGAPVVGAFNNAADVRPEDLVHRRGASTSSLVLVGFGVAGAVLLLAGIGALVASTSSRKGAVPVETSR